MQGCDCNATVVGSIPKKIRGNVRILNILRSTSIQYAMNRKLETERFDTRFPLPTLLVGGYSVKLKKMFWLVLTVGK